MRRLFAILGLILLSSAPASRAQSPVCVSCEKPTVGSYAEIDSPSFLQRQTLCNGCSKHNQRCFECELPTKSGSTRLKDGRILCRRHATTAVLDPHTGTAIFREAQRDVTQLLRGLGRFPDKNVEAQLISRPQLLALLKDHPTINAKLTRGVTQTWSDGQGRFKHRIYLLDGLPRDHTLAVAAHEYTHTWLAENVTRTLDAKTVEGFCELVAYKVAVKRNLPVEQKTILANAYTQGQLASLRKASEDYRFYEVVRWMKQGQDESMTASHTASVLTRPTGAPELHTLSTTTKTPVPEQLTLKGISGSTKRPFALVNDRTLETNEAGNVRVGDSTVRVRCLEINEDSVLLELTETRERVELKLRGK